MNGQQTFRQCNAFAMLNGLKFGIYWCFGFVCMVRGIGNDALNSLGMLVTISAPVLGGYIARRFENHVRPDGPVSFGKAYLHAALMYFYASAILAIVSYAYFRWFDHGQFIESLATLINSAEAQQAMKEAQLDIMLNNAAQQSGFATIEEMIRSFTPTTIAASLFNQNIFIGLILALPTALFSKTRKSDMV